MGLAEAMTEAAKAAGPTTAELVGVGVGSPGTIDPAKIIPILEGTKFQFTKEVEWYRPEDHQGVNSCLVVEGLPLAERTENGFGYARVVEVHPGESVVAPLSSLVCKMEPA